MKKRLTFTTDSLIMCTTVSERKIHGPVHGHLFDPQGSKKFHFLLKKTLACRKRQTVSPIRMRKYGKTQSLLTRNEEQTRMWDRCNESLGSITEIHGDTLDLGQQVDTPPLRGNYLMR